MGPEPILGSVVKGWLPMINFSRLHGDVLWSVLPESDTDIT